MATIIKQQSSTLGALNASTPVLDISDADVLGISVGGTFVGTITFYCSLDNVTFYQFCVHAGSSTTSTTDTATTTSGGVFSKPVQGLKFFKATMTVYTSGSADLVLNSTRFAK